jgi:SAM-dependent methyltransferase
VSLRSDVDEAYALALTHCAECRDYHLTRPYLVASGVRGGAAGDREAMAPLLDEFAPPGARILIAAAADATLLSFVLDEIGPRTPAITVADQCPTPLILCRHLAERRAANVQTLEADIVTGDLGGPYDLIIAHAVLPFIAPQDRTAFLANLARRLAPGGHLLLAYPTQPSTLHSSGFVDKVLSGLAARDINLPDPPAPLLDALHRLVAAPARDFDGDALDLDALMHNSGLRAERVVDLVGRTRAIGERSTLARPNRRYVIACRL